MGTKTAFAGGMAAGATLLFFVGASVAVAPDGRSEVAVNPSHTAAPPAPETVTRTVTVDKPVPVPTMPPACADYLSQVDSAIKSLYDYEDGMAPTEQALSDGLKMIVEQDASGLNSVRDRITHIENTTAGPLQVLVASHADIVKAHDACHKALGG